MKQNRLGEVIRPRRAITPKDAPGTDMVHTKTVDFYLDSLPAHSNERSGQAFDETPPLEVWLMLDEFSDDKEFPMGTTFACGCSVLYDGKRWSREVCSDHDAVKYGRELDVAAELLQQVHPIGRVKAIGRMEVVQALREVLEHDHEIRSRGGVSVGEVREVIRELWEFEKNHTRAHLQAQNLMWKKTEAVEAALAKECRLIAARLERLVEGRP